MRKSLRLSHAVLASSIFVAPVLLADTTITGVNTPVVGASPPYLTSLTANIEITPTGQISNGAGDGMRFDNNPAALIVDANNTNAGIAITATGGHGVSILATGNGAIITNNVGSTIRSTTAAAINIAGDLSSITNNGTLLGTTAAINVAAGGTNATVNNTGGTITSAVGTGIIVSAGGSGFVLSNSVNGATPGIVSATAGDAIMLSGNFSSITNNAGSSIVSTTGNGILFNGAVTGTVTNSGTISSSGVGKAAINLDSGAYTGTITNTATGVITNSLLNGGPALLINTSFGTINNAGTIQIPLGNAPAISVSANVTGTLNNTGTIKGDLGNAITLQAGSGLTGINNAGTISATDPTQAIIYAAGNVVIPNGIINTGNITSITADPAIDLSAAGNNIPLFQNGGTIAGNVFLTDLGGANALTMTAGTINGTVLSSSTTASTLNFSGGSILNTVTLGNINGNVVNLSGTSLQALNGGTGIDTFNLSGGSFTALNGMGGADIINVTKTLTTTGTISNVPTLNVNNSGTVYTANGKISGLNTALNVNAGATMIANAGLAGIAGTGNINIANTGIFQINSGSTVNMGQVNTNAGSLIIQNNAALNLTGGSYNQTGDFTTTLASIDPATGFGVIKTNMMANVSGTIRPQLTPAGTMILEGDTFDIVQATGAIVDTSTIVQPPSVVLFFEKATKAGADCDNGGNCIELLAHRNPLALVATPDIPLAVASALDPLVGTTTNPELNALFFQLQLMPDVQSVSNALLMLAPPFNNQIPVSSRISMDNAFESAHARLEAMSKVNMLPNEAIYETNRNYELYNGINYGDANVIAVNGQYGLWAKGTANVLDQHKRNQIEGFKAESTGIAVGYDWIPNDFTMVGIGQSYTKVNTTDYTDQRNSVETRSLQTTVYSTFVPYEKCQENTTQTVYLETMLAIASHKYDTIRNIVIGPLTAQANASFYGWHYGMQADLGYAFISQDNYIVAPIARFRYTYLDIGNYSENSAGGLNLTVQNDDVDEAVAGLGVRWAVKRDFVQAVYVPEFSIFLLYDFAGQAQEMQSNFLGGGNSFYVNSVKPAQYIQQYGAGITAYTSDGYSFALKGFFEHREQFFGYNIFAQLKYSWG